MGKKGLCLLLVLCCVAVLSGCSGRHEEDRQPAPTLPPAETHYLAPDQDTVISEGGEYRLFLPGRDDLGLISRSTVLDPADLSDTAEMLPDSLFSAFAHEASLPKEKMKRYKSEFNAVRPVKLSAKETVLDSMWVELERLPEFQFIKRTG